MTREVQVQVLKDVGGRLRLLHNSLNSVCALPVQSKQLLQHFLVVVVQKQYSVY